MFYVEKVNELGEYGLLTYFPGEGGGELVLYQIRSD